MLNQKKLMKKIKNSLPFFAVIFTLLFFSRCTMGDDIQQLKNTVDSLQIIVGTPVFNTQVHLDFVDAKTQTYLSNKSVFVTVSGKDAATVFNNIGEKKLNYESKISFMDLILDPNQINADKMKTTPVEFDVTVKSAGYADVTQKIYFNNTNKQNVTIPLINLTNAPAGVQVDVKTNFVSTGSDGKTTTASSANSDAGKQSVVIPAGVVVKDVNGNKISGAISSQIVFIDPRFKEAQNAIPGGSSVQAKLKDGTTANVELVSAGMFMINLKAGDKVVKTLDGEGIKLRTVINPNLINPKTGKTVRENDVIDLWSIEDGTGKWNYEKSSIIRSMNGDLVVEETINHLSGWNLAFASDACPNGPKFVFKGDKLKLDVKLTAAFSGSQNSKEFTVDTQSPDYNNFSFSNVPKNQAATFKFESSATNFGEKYIFTPSSIDMSNMCEAKTYEITITKAAAQAEVVKINLKITATSGGTSAVIVAPNTVITLKEANGTTGKQVELKNGAATFSVELNKEYTLVVGLGSFSGEGKMKVVTQGNEYVVTFTPVKTGSTAATPITFKSPVTSDKSVDITYDVVTTDKIF